MSARTTQRRSAIGWICSPGAKASLRIFRIVTKPAKLLGETAHLIPNAVAIQRPQSASSQKLSLGIINTPYPGSLMTGVGARCNGCCRVGLINAFVFTDTVSLGRKLGFSYICFWEDLSPTMCRSPPLATRSYWMSRAAASISWARGRTRMSSVKFSQRTVPERSTRNSAGREMSWPSGPAAACSKS